MNAQGDKILLIEDDANLGLVLQENLELQGFAVTLCDNGEDGRQTYLRGRFDLCLIDVMLPKLDGFSLAKEIRKIDNDTPIIFLTAKSLKEDRIEGFKLGGDDYVVKPFSMEELTLRIQAVLKRSNKSSSSGDDSRLFKIGRYEFDAERQILALDGNGRKLTHKESELLKLLCLHQNALLERELALNLIWGDDTIFNARSMDVFISKLRKYLSRDERIEIVNVHGRGYKMMVKPSL